MTDRAIEIPHPLTDAGAAEWIATELHAQVVALTPAMSDFLHRATAAGQRPLIVTGTRTRMTHPLREALTEAGGHWIVRTGAHEYYDARSGRTLSTPAAILAAEQSPVSASFTRGALIHRMQLIVSFATRHRVTREVLLGGAADSAATAVLGAAPVAWGSTEPAVAPWNRVQLTEYSRRRMPDSSRWVIVGDDPVRQVGTIAVDRTSEGVEETTHLWIDRGPAPDERQADLEGDAAAALRAAAAHGMPLMGFAFAALGAPDLAARPLASAPPQPLAVFIGPPGVRQLDLPLQRWAEEFGATTVGRPRLPGLLVPLGGRGGGGWERIRRMLDALDPHAAAAALGLVPPELRADAAAARDGGGSHA